MSRASDGGLQELPFRSFKRERIEADDGVRINALHGGDGPPLLLLHGYPQTHFMWRRLAPPLAERFHVVCRSPRLWRQRQARWRSRPRQLL